MATVASLLNVIEEIGMTVSVTGTVEIVSIVIIIQQQSAQ